MSKIRAGLEGITGAIAAAAVLVVVLVAGVWIGNARKDGEIVQPAALLQPQQDAVQLSQPTPNAEGAVTEDTVVAEPDPDAQTDLAAPAFDEVRREPDGTTIVAGRAAPGGAVQVLRDGEVIATATADVSGKFAIVTLIEPDGQAHVLTLSQSVNDATVASLDEIILAPTEMAVVVAETPTQAPVVVAQTAPDAVAGDAEAVVAGAKPDAEVAGTTSTGDEDDVAQSGPTPDETIANATEPDTASPVAVLKSTADGVELLNPAASSVMDTVALDTIGYSDAGDVQLAGRAQARTKTVRVYLDNDAVINLPVDNQGNWRGEVPDVDEGIYTLRVDEVAQDGSVTSRIETPFKRETAAVLAQAAAGQDGPIKVITVQTGATLWAIARERYGDGQLYLRVVEANAADIRDPDLIYPGQVFDLPD